MLRRWLIEHLEGLKRSSASIIAEDELRGRPEHGHEISETVDWTARMGRLVMAFDALPALRSQNYLEAFPSV